MKRLLFFFVIFLCMVFTSLAQNVGINDDSATPDASAMLDVKSSTKGILIPRVELTATNAASPVTSPATGLLVYNTATAGTAPNNVTPGFYYWDNNSKWFSLRDGLSTAPYGAYSDLTDQSISSTTTAYAINFSNNDGQYGFTHTAGSSAITATYGGVYLITFSGVFYGPSSTVFNVWLRTNGANLDNTNTIFSLSGSTTTNRVVTVTYIVTLTAGQNFDLVMQATSTSARLDFTAAQSSPTRPACPSIILTVNKISN